MPARLGGQPLAAFGIFGEELAKVQIPDRVVVGFKGFPGRALGKGWDSCGHVRIPLRDP